MIYLYTNTYVWKLLYKKMCVETSGLCWCVYTCWCIYTWFCWLYTSFTHTHKHKDAYIYSGRSADRRSHEKKKADRHIRMCCKKRKSMPAVWIQRISMPALYRRISIPAHTTTKHIDYIDAFPIDTKNIDACPTGKSDYVPTHMKHINGCHR